MSQTKAKFITILTDHFNEPEDRAAKAVVVEIVERARVAPPHLVKDEVVHFVLPANRHRVEESAEHQIVLVAGQHVGVIMRSSSPAQPHPLERGLVVADGCSSAQQTDVDALRDLHEQPLQVESGQSSDLSACGIRVDFLLLFCVLWTLFPKNSQIAPPRRLRNPSTSHCSVDFGLISNVRKCGCR